MSLLLWACVLLLVLLVVYYLNTRDPLRGRWRYDTLRYLDVSVSNENGLDGQLAVLLQPGKDASSQRRVLATVQARRKNGGYEGPLLYGTAPLGTLTLTPQDGKLRVQLAAASGDLVTGSGTLVNEYQDLLLIRSI